MESKFNWNFEHGKNLFETAIDEFVEKGYDKASINIILKNAGMSKGQFYYHFENKENLYFALINELIAKKQSFLGSRIKPEDMQQDIFSIFHLQIKLGMEFGKDYPTIYRFSEAFLREQGKPIYQKAMSKHNFENNDQIKTPIDMAYERGDFREDLPKTFILKTVGYLFTKIPEISNVEGIEDVEAYLLHLIDFMRHGLASKSNK
ncbi:TetR/AcrR family transcriptional regulator [Wukongibacter sp. M2B1]|uniref:TetR/AcrR family transcriptional regulator n=1 Tax=Wukongibacter sp. M2B1 TaxID=3088895 RepID=UPI003D7900DD